MPFFLLWAVYADGSICLDILQNQWSPIYDVAAILTSIQVYFANTIYITSHVLYILPKKKASTYAG